MEQYFGRSIANITASTMLNIPVGIQDLQESLNKVIKQHDALRIRLDLQGGVPMQYVSAFVSRTFEIVQFTTQNEFDSWIQVVARTPFDLRGYLNKVFIVTIGKQIGFVYHIHHLTADAWTLLLLINAVTQNLQGKATNSNSYLDYLTFEKEYEDSSSHEKDRAYFLSCFEQCSEPVYLRDKQAKNIESNRLSFILGGDDAVKIRTFCTDTGISPYALFMGALAMYMYRIKGAQSLYIGTTVLNRVGRKNKETAGLFVNTVPVLFHIDDSQSAIENLRKNALSIASVFRHQKYQYINFLKDIREKHGFNDRLYDIMLNYQNAVLTDNGKGVTGGWNFCGCQGESLNIHINDRFQDGAYHLDYDYQMELFSQVDIERLHRHLMNLILDMVDNPEKNPQDLRLLTDAEYQRVIHDFNSTAVDYPKDKCVHQLFEEQVAKTPDAVAVVFEGTEYTYRQINGMANSLAHLLRAKGVARDDIVAIISKRSHKVIVAQLAVLKAGGSYLPIDPNHPRKRIDFMLDDAKCKLSLTLGVEANYVNSIDMENESVFCGNQAAIENVNSPDDLCYVIYTSGSTGLPKGTMLRHQSIANYCNNNNKNSVIYRLITDHMKSVVSTTTIGFDIFITESLLPLLNGMTIIFANEWQASTQEGLNKLVLQTDADVLQTTPSKMQLLMMDNTQTGYLKKIKALILGGEALDASVVDRLKMSTFSNIYNIYGPTETTVWSSNATVESSSDITIGKPIANTQAYILNKHQNPLPIGIAGELCISGDGVGRGYLNRPELTAEKFVPNPFIRGSRMYKTGDLARWREDGQLEYLGRMDNQVKIHGLRIELGEIEAALMRFQGIKQAVVVDRQDETGRQYLCACYISDGDVEKKALRADLAKALPRYMVPHLFMRVEGFPTTPSGKIDRKAFPSPDFTQSHSDTEYIAPVTGQEKTLTRTLETVLGVSPVGMADDFFDLGCDSLKAIELVAKARNEGIHINLQDVFDYPTAALLTEHIAAGDRPAVRYRAEDFTEIHQMLDNNKIKGTAAFVKQPLGDVLITGVTGWLGAHILNEFLSAESGIAYCLVRGEDYADSQTKLKTAIEYYFGDSCIDYNRIIPICGDITNKILMDEQVNTIIHCAATVKHYGSYQYSHEINVGGTENMIALAKAKGARLLHISTESVSGHDFEQPLDLPSAIFDETKLYIGQPLENVYVRSKFEAEAAVLRAKLAGLDAAVIRVGNLSNRYSDAKFQKNYHENATLTRLKAFVDLKLYLKSLRCFPLEFSPVDCTAKAIIAIGQHLDKAYSVFHAYNPKNIRFGGFVRALAAAGVKMRPVSMKRFVEAVQATAKDSETAHIHKAFIHDLGADGSLKYKSSITLKSDFTTWYLSKASFVWPEIDADYLIRFIQYFNDIGYWTMKPRINHLKELVAWIRHIFTCSTTWII